MAEVNLYCSLLIKQAVHREAAKELGPAAVDFYEAMPALKRAAPPLREQVSILAQELRESQRPIIVCGTEVVRQTTPALAADHALLLRAMNKPAGLFYLMPGANGFGSSVLSAEASSFSKTLEDIEQGTVKGLIVAESDPFGHFQDRQRLDLAIEKLDLLVVLDYRDSLTAHQAHVFLPVSTLYETGGVFINQEGRVQAAVKVYPGGIPLARISGGNHPPRVYSSVIPGGELRAAWEVLAQLANGELEVGEETTRASVWGWLAEANPAFADIPPIDELPDDGVRLRVSKEDIHRFSLDWLKEMKKSHAPGDGLELLLTDWTFGTEELSAHSPPLGRLEKSPCLFMHIDDATGLGLTHGDTVSIELDRGSLEVNLCAVENMAPGVMVLPRHHLLEWQKIERSPKFVRFEEIEKIRA